MIIKLRLIEKEIVVKEVSIDTSNIKIKTIPIANNKFTFNTYEVSINNDIKDICWDFASRIILGKNQFDRLTPSWVNNEELENLIRIQRSYAGKIGEVAFLILLVKNNPTVSLNSLNLDDMFKIYEGQRNTDRYDFKTNDNKTIDIKAAFREIHKNLVVNLEQLTNIPKDYYVGVKLNADDYDSKNKIIYSDSIDSCIIYGYAQYDFLKKLATNDKLGEGPCKAIKLEKLLSIDSLIKMI